MSAYQTTKLAVLRFSEFMNVEYLDKGVLTLVVHPGAIMTELASNMPGETHGSEFFPTFSYPSLHFPFSSFSATTQEKRK